MEIAYDVKKCYEDLSSEAVQGLKGCYDSVLLDEAARLFGSGKFQASETLLLFMQVVRDEVKRLRETDEVVKGYWTLLQKTKEASLKRKLAKLSGRKGKAAVLEIPSSDEEPVEEASDVESPEPDPEVPPKKRAELKAAQDGAVLRLWGLLLELAAKTGEMSARVLPLAPSQRHQAAKRLLELHVFSFDLHASLSCYWGDSLHESSKKFFLSKLVHCVSAFNLAAYTIVPPCMQSLMDCAVEPDASGKLRGFLCSWAQLDVCLRGDGAEVRASACRGPLQKPVKLPRKKPLVRPPALELASDQVCRRRLLDCFSLRHLAAGWECCSASPCECRSKCSDFLSFFFGLPPLGLEPSRAELSCHACSKDELLARVASAHAEGDPRGSLRGMLPRGGDESLEELAVDVGLELLGEEWSEARALAEGVPLRAHVKAFVLQHGSYRVEHFRRAVRACELLSQARPLWEILGQLSPLCQDLRLLMQFAEGCVARALVYREDGGEASQAVLREIVSSLQGFPMLAPGAIIECYREAMGTLRVFFRLALRRRFPGADYAGKLPHLLGLEEAIFCSACGRVPLLLLGHLWPRLHGCLTERRPELRSLPVEELEKIYERLDLSAVSRLLSFDREGAPCSDHAEMRALVARFADRLRGLAFSRFAKCAMPSFNKQISEDAETRYYFLSAEEKACWRDPRALELLRRLFVNGRKLFFLPPFMGGLRREQVSREVGEGGVALLYSPYSDSLDPSIDCLLRFPVASRVFAKAHAGFRILPVPYEISPEKLRSMHADIRSTGASCWCVGHFVKMPGDSLKQIFSCRHIPLEKRVDQLHLGSVFSEFQASPLSAQHLAAQRLVEEVCRSQLTRFGRALAQLKGSPQQQAWTERLERLTGERHAVDVVLFSDSEVDEGYGESVLLLPAARKRDELLHRLFEERALQVFLEEKKVMYKLRGRSFTPCHKIGHFLSVHWTVADVKTAQEFVRDDRIQLLVHGVKAVLFSDVASGLLHEEVACRLPLKLCKQERLLRVLRAHGISLYAWGAGFVEDPCPSFDVLEGARRLTLDMIFDESENLYDHTVYHREEEEAKQRVRRHVEAHLQKHLRDDGFPTAAASGGGCIGDGSVLCFFRVDQLRVHSKEDLSWAVARASAPLAPLTLLGPDEPPRPVLLSSPHKSRVYQRRCVGSAACPRVAVREVRGMRKTVVCAVCEPWRELSEEERAWSACEHFDGQECNAAAVAELQHEDLGAPRRFCRRHAVLEVPSAKETDGCCEEAALLWQEVPASLSVQSGEAVECARFNSLKDAGPLFGEPRVEAGCLEVQMRLEAQLRGLLERTPKKAQLYLTRDKTTAGMLQLLFGEVGERRSVVWSLDQLSELSEADCKKALRGQACLRGQDAFVEALEKDVRRVQWLRRAHESGEEVRCRGDGELPCDRKASERAEGLFVDERPVGAFLEALPRGLGLQLKDRSPEVQRMQERLAAQMWRLQATAAACLGAPSAATETSFHDGSGTRHSDEVSVGWLCVRRVFEQTNASSLDRQGLCWGDVLEKNLGQALLFFRRQLFWACVPDLALLPRYGLHFCEVEGASGARPPLWVDVLAALDYHVEPAVALRELRAVDAKFKELLQKACRSASRTFAVGLVNSVFLNYRESLKAAGLDAATPAAFVEHLLEPRLEEMGPLYELLMVLFQDEEWQRSSEVRRVPLKVVHVSALAQEYFWSPAMRSRLRVALRQVQAHFDKASLRVEKRAQLLEKCFDVSGTPLKAEKQDWKGPGLRRVREFWEVRSGSFER